MADSFWLSEETAPLPVRRIEGRPDAVVIGGGVTGCAGALALAEAGLRVPLHEAREVASGASGRNGGFALGGGAGATRWWSGMPATSGAPGTPMGRGSSRHLARRSGRRAARCS